MKKYLLNILIILGPSISFGQITDVDTELLNRIQASNFFAQRILDMGPGGPGFHVYWLQYYSRTNIGIKSYYIESATVTTHPEQAVALPIAFDEQIKSQYNCGDVIFPWTETLSTTIATNHSLQLSTTLRMSSSVSNTTTLSLNIPVPTIGLNLGFSGSETVVKATDLTNGNQQTWGETRTESDQISTTVSVPSWTKFYLKARQESYSVSIPFSATITIDGVITAHLINQGSKAPSIDRIPFWDIPPSDFGIQNVVLSQFLSHDQRTFLVNGIITNSKSSKTKLTSASESVNKENPTCLEIIKEMDDSDDDKILLYKIHSGINLTKYELKKAPLVDGKNYSFHKTKGVIEDLNEVAKKNLTWEPLSFVMTQAEKQTITVHRNNLNNLPPPLFSKLKFSILSGQFIFPIKSNQQLICCDTGMDIEHRYISMDENDCKSFGWTISLDPLKCQ